MSYEEDDFLPVSAIQHLLFCERQCALIHLERIWEENLLTASGRIDHDKVDEGRPENRRDLHIARGLPLRSLCLGLAGRADVVEFRRQESGSRQAVVLPRQRGFWSPYPVEYKHGRPKPGECDRAQLCAQAICLEEMLGVEIPAGALFYHATRKRQEVDFTPALRSLVEHSCLRLHELFAEGETPPPVNDKRCGMCSLKGLCLPESAGRNDVVGDYVERSLREIEQP